VPNICTILVPSKSNKNNSKINNNNIITWNENCNNNRDVTVEVQIVPTLRAVCVVPIILPAVVIICHCRSTISQELDVRPHTLYKHKNLLY
jgi:hypothetical protein